MEGLDELSDTFDTIEKKIKHWASKFAKERELFKKSLKPEREETIIQDLLSEGGKRQFEQYMKSNYGMLLKGFLEHMKKAVPEGKEPPRGFLTRIGHQVEQLIQAGDAEGIFNALFRNFGLSNGRIQLQLDQCIKAVLTKEGQRQFEQYARESHAATHFEAHLQNFLEQNVRDAAQFQQVLTSEGKLEVEQYSREVNPASRFENPYRGFLEHRKQNQVKKTVVNFLHESDRPAFEAYIQGEGVGKALTQVCSEFLNTRRHAQVKAVYALYSSWFKRCGAALEKFEKEKSNQPTLKDYIVNTLKKCLNYFGAHFSLNAKVGVKAILHQHKRLHLGKEVKKREEQGLVEQAPGEDIEGNEGRQPEGEVQENDKPAQRSSSMSKAAGQPHQPGGENKKNNRSKPSREV